MSGDSDIELILDENSISSFKIDGWDEQLLEIDKQIKAINLQMKELQWKRQELEKKKEKIKYKRQEEKSAALAQKDWDRNDYSWSKDLFMNMKTIFKISNLRPHQLPTMNATLEGNDCILVMPTGGGKSLCFQLPALLSNGITLVVSPLLSLMEDQLMSLHDKGIEAKMLSATSSREYVNQVHKDMVDANSSLRLLYVTPEKLAKSKRFMSKLQNMHKMGRFARLAIDEVHCCSQWGHDFRPDYKFLGIMRQMFPGTPILGLTATAASRVIQDVQKILNIQGCLVLKASFNRPNLFYEVRLKPPDHKACVKKLATLLLNDFKNQSGIIYTMTIKDTEELAKNLRNEGIKIAPYHANLDAAMRSKIHKKWVQNTYQAVVATIAFGMGIDKPDVRFVIHHCISKSMENFYQESGRAGRDDKPAKCIVFWRFGDLFRQSTMVFTEQTGLDNLYGIINYCLDSNSCRRKLIANHFDERWEEKDCDKMCDHCCKERITKEIDLSQYGKQVVSILKKASSLDIRLTGLKLIDAWLGKGPTNVRLKEATASNITKDMAESIVAFLLIDGYLREDFHFTPYSTISYIIPGHKYEAGLAPSPMEILCRTINEPSSSKRKLNSDSSPAQLKSLINTKEESFSKKTKIIF